jgi:hypothetical protein
VQVAGEQRVQPTLLLLLAPGQREDLAVARIRGLVAERERRDRRGAEDLVHEAELDLAEALAAQLGVQMRGVQAALLDALAQRSHRPQQLLVREVERLEGPDLLSDELVHPVQMCLELGFRREVPHAG